ncbi:MAG: hypothetical protein JWM52_541 [Candidatus Saccharibacteria bacterium]|nr:hypothetical protein [Candidatus Saccharibacteria bacterium]
MGAFRTTLQSIHSSLLLITGFIALTTIGAVFSPSPSAAAVSGNFIPGQIIDDAVFYNSGSMSSDQIQAFLNSKVTNCDTNGTQPASDWGFPGITHAQFAQYKREGSHGVRQDSGFHAPPYTCLRNFSQSTPQMEAASGYCGYIGAATRTAATIIKDVATACGINPQVLIVLLDKEQSLITDNWPLQRQYDNATGFACPDTAPCDPAYAGFFYQVYYAAKQFKIYQENPNDYNYVAGRSNRIYWQTNLGNFINSTGNEDDSSRYGQSTCGYQNVPILNQATAALYTYTPYQPNQHALANMYGTGDACSAYGNRNFWRTFTDWFGASSSPPATKCDSKVYGVVCVWSVRKNDGSQFLTSSESELSSAMYSYGWINEGIDFYASSISRLGTAPVHRLLSDNKHYYTASQSEYTSLVGSGWIDEGVPFYEYTSDTSTNVSYSVYKLYNPSLNQYYLTIDAAKKTSLMNMGYSVESGSFNTFSGLIAPPLPAAGRANIYMLNEYGSYFYTTSLPEVETVLKRGYLYDRVLTTANATSSGTPIYRLQKGNRHFYTASTAERDNAIGSYGFTSEGIGFYVDASSAQIYRLAKADGSNVYTSSLDETMSLANTDGWIYEGTLVNNGSEIAPVYRFLNLLNNRHFYTISLNEAARITNRGWRYETISFSANTTTGLPVYRLLLRDKHLYTTNVDERNIAINKYGYVYEGIAFYVSSTPTDKPTYRLQGGSDEYFYTASAAERDMAVSRYKYSYEGEGFYLP